VGLTLASPLAGATPGSAPTVDLTPPVNLVPDADNPGSYLQELTVCAYCQANIGVAPPATMQDGPQTPWSLWLGIGADAGEYSSGTRTFGTNGRLYSAPRGNQYFRSFIGLEKVFAAASVGILAYDTFEDFTDPNVSSAQAYGDLAIGAAALASPIYSVPAAVYGIASHYYPGGRSAYNAALSEAVNAAEGGGPQ